MCGILGQIVPDGSTVDRERLRAANEKLRARGPDGAGEHFDRNVGLAMRRLAVIDLEGGNQPLLARGGEVVAFQNGEIYNHLDLRRELIARGVRFQTHSDTEALAHGFDAWGMAGLLERADGMFALAILDRRERTLWLARDRFGEKPLFWTMDLGASAGAGFAFASSIDALRELTGRRFDVDRRALDDYLALHYVPGRSTIFRDVWRVLPGELLKVDARTLAIERKRWWSVPAPPEHDATDDELRAALDHAVRSRLVADVPVGVFLSGGLDSSLVAALAAKAKGGIDTFTMGFAGTVGSSSAASSEHDESRFADLVARHIGSTHHHFVFDASSFDTLLPEVASALDEPVGDPAQLPLFWLCREARKVATVVLSGEGADELFGGYDYYASAAPAVGWREQFARWRDRGDRHADEETTPSGFPLVMTSAERRELLPDVDRDPESATRREDAERTRAQLAAAKSELQRRSLADLGSWLPDDLLVKLDRMAMAHSLEGRAPYLQPQLAAMALALPAARRTTATRRKVALAQAAEPLLPTEIRSRRKHGFVLPMREWLRDYFGSFGRIEKWRAERPLPWLDGAGLEAFVARSLARPRGRPRALFALALLSEWWAARQRASASR